MPEYFRDASNKVELCFNSLVVPNSMRGRSFDSRCCSSMCSLHTIKTPPTKHPYTKRNKPNQVAELIKRRFSARRDAGSSPVGGVDHILWCCFTSHAGGYAIPNSELSLNNHLAGSKVLLCHFFLKRGTEGTKYCDTHELGA